jgi:hypothetical protein
MFISKAHYQAIVQQIADLHDRLMATYQPEAFNRHHAASIETATVQTHAASAPVQSSGQERPEAEDPGLQFVGSQIENANLR